VLKRLSDEGATCHVPSSHASAPADFEYAGNDRVVLVPDVDLADAPAVDAFYAAVPTLWASINLAGGFAMARIDQTSPDDFAAMMDLNARTAFLCCRAATRAMLASGTEGRIVNVVARAALEPRQGSGMIAYAASKAAVAAITVGLADEVKGKGILVNAVAPSILDTPANRAGMPKADFSKWVALDDAAEAICHLASPHNMATSGALVPLYGKA
jgi:NAD(P)-dependent dehydrogenase (short-subunit alcohol dehydrogenase family)